MEPLWPRQAINVLCQELALHQDNPTQPYSRQVAPQAQVRYMTV